MLNINYLKYLLPNSKFTDGVTLQYFEFALVTSTVYKVQAIYFSFVTSGLFRPFRAANTFL